ncbi:hypothetical protein PV10_09122 [Exophiala mesophila]|uniref:Uncharacterized protein n=1 Tax=Exophiala mesophila TaxID=212818 RepID=A0A0D1WHB4_EXOME|nr:uncharacterized protein PV10_09122 [Exophiala mesophila]KIV88205.1 hypothetical protein PV10_09122 [Exophiala mesophila]
MAAENSTAVSPASTKGPAAATSTSITSPQAKIEASSDTQNLSTIPASAAPGGSEVQVPQVDGTGDKAVEHPTAEPPLSPAVSKTSSQGASSHAQTSGPVALDSAARTTPIHPSIPTIKVPLGATDTTAPNTNPLTLAPFTEAELQKYGYEKLRSSLINSGPPGQAHGQQNGGINLDKIREMKEETALLLKQKLEERETKIREIEKEMDEKEKIREVERKVFRKKMGKDATEAK